MWSVYVTQNNNQLDQVELKDLFKKALVLLDQSSKVAAPCAAQKKIVLPYP
jgi:hypothetical protein